MAKETKATHQRSSGLVNSFWSSMSVPAFDTQSVSAHGLRNGYALVGVQCHHSSHLRLIWKCFKNSNFRSTDKLDTLVFTTGSEWLLDALQSFRWFGYSSHLSIAFLLHSSFAVAILGYEIFNFVSKGYCFVCGQSKFAFDYNTSRNYK